VKFVERFVGAKDRTTYAAIYFEEPRGIPELSRYDFSSPWTFEIRITQVFPFRGSSTQMLHSIERVNQEIPDLDTRGEWVGYKKGS
jgi:hypothetical protein